MCYIPATVDIWFVNLGLQIHDIEKSFTLFGREVYFYGVIIASAMLIGLGLVSLVAKKTGQVVDFYLDVLIWGVIFGIIGARTYYVLNSWDYYGEHPEAIIKIWEGGLAIYGAVIGATLATFVLCRVKKQKFTLIMDTACIGLITGQCLGRWSNFVNMEAFGDFTENKLAMALNLAKVNPNMVSQNQLSHSFALDGVTYIQVHPTYLYESLWSFGVLILLLVVTLKIGKKFDGEVFLLYCTGYGLGRFWIEGLRTDQLKIGHTDIAVSQVVSAVLVTAGIVLLIIGFSRAKKKAAAALSGEDAGQEDIRIEFTETADAEPAKTTDDAMKNDGIPSENRAEDMPEAIPSEEASGKEVSGTEKEMPAKEDLAAAEPSMEETERL